MQVTYLGTRSPQDVPNTVEIELSRKYLLAELARLDLLLQRQIQRWQQAGQDPSDAFRGLYISDQEAEALLSRPVNTNWGEMAQTGTADPFAPALKQAALQSQAIAEAARHQNHTPRLLRLAQAFNLQPFEVDVLLICLARHVDLRYERIFGYLQDDVTKKQPTVNLALDLFSPAGFERMPDLTRFTNQAALFRYHLLEQLPDDPATSLLGQALTLERSVAAWLLGEYHSPTLASLQTWLRPARRLPGDDLLVQEEQQFSEAVLEKKPLLAFYGTDEAAQAAAARGVVEKLKRPLLECLYVPGEGSSESPQLALEIALRDARLTGAIPFLRGWSAALDDGALPPAFFAELCAFPGVLILATPGRWQARGYEADRRLFWMEFAAPAFARRVALWQHYLGEAAEGLDLDGVAGQFQLTAGQIRDAVAGARNAAAQAGEPISEDDLLAGARSHSNPRLSSLARKIEPHYRWEDIILPEDQLALLHELVDTVRGRPLVLDEWGVGQKLVSSRGVTVLFAGPPGTGKTMAAEIIAAELGLDLFKIDLSTIVSKYIGETEKNLERIFIEAETSNAILFFDEADALFGKRSEVRDSHDRYANIEISYLLQRMEAYDGVTILATNLRSNLDEAFTRRLQFAVDFPFPEQGDRLRIWQTLFPPDVPRSGELDFGMLARRFKLAGGNIRNVIVSAAYLAASNGGVLTMEHLLHGTRRELQKMGKLVGDGETNNG